MILINFFRILILIFAISLAQSCAFAKTHLPSDIAPNSALGGYHRMEFDITDANGEKKEIGLGNISISEIQDLSKVSFKVYGIYSGVLYMKSEACSIDTATNFNKALTFKLSDLIPKPLKCSIKLTAETKTINNLQHNIVETGELKLNVIPEKSKPIQMEYIRTDSDLGIMYKTYLFEGQGSMQRSEGELTQSETFKLITDLDGGGSYRIAGCGENNVTKGSYTDKTFIIKFFDLYKKNYLKREDSCDFEILVIPNQAKYSFVGRFSLNVYDKTIVKLEPPEYYIKYSKWYRHDFIYSNGRQYITICSINDFYANANICSTRYYKDIVYWIRSITSNGRKSIFALKNNEIIWKE